MLTLVEIPSGWWQWRPKGQEPGPNIEVGRYYQVDARGWSKADRQALGLVAATNGRGFLWLAPPERWVKALLDGYKPPESALFGRDDVVPPWDDLGLHRLVAKLHPCQRQEVVDACAVLARGVAYRRGLPWGIGSGKSLAALAVAQCVNGPVVVAAPRYIHDEWTNQATEWGLPEPVVTTYEGLHKIEHADALILDEAHLLKNPETRRHREVLRLSERAMVVLGLTGTPVAAKGPLDWRWLRAVYPGSVPREERVWRLKFGLDTKLREVKPGVKAYVTTQWNIGAVDGLVRPYIHPIDAKHLLAHLPPIQTRVLRVAQPRDYESIRAGVATERNKSKRTAQLRQVADGFVYNDLHEPIRLPPASKIDAVEEFVEGLGEPVLIYAAWDETINMLAERFPAAAVIRGETADVEGQKARFTSGLTDMLIANSRYSAGMNLQARCRVVVFVSPSPSSVDLEQAIGRVYRQGQTRGVVVVRCIADGTLDDRTWELLDGHKSLSEATLTKMLEASL